METTTLKKRRGRPSGKQYRPYTVSLDPEIAEWARDEPEGLSGLIRDALAQIKDRRDNGMTHKTDLYYLFPNPDLPNDLRHNVWLKKWRLMNGIIVFAENEAAARYIAGSHAAEEEGHVWLDPAQTCCVHLVPGGIASQVLCSYIDNDY